MINSRNDRPAAVGYRRLALVCALALLIATPALAKTTRKLSYKRAESFRCFVRLLRVDLKLKIEERDLEGGYVLFEYQDPLYKRISPASAEFIELPAEDGTQLKVVLDIPQGSGADEIGLLDKFEDKLKQEFGKR